MIALTSNLDGTQAVSTANGWTRRIIDLTGVGAGATLVPSAYTVQLLNPQPLQTTEGILYFGRMTVMPDLSQRLSDRVETIRGQFIEYQAPRLLSAAKLSLRGVQCHAYPLEMSDVSAFRFLQPETDGTATISANFDRKLAGWTPIVLANPSEVPVEALVTVEYRLRFDLESVACASHRQHPVSSDRTWAKAVEEASRLTHGVTDIVEDVANAGMAAGKLASMVGLI
jgi:hypothetical protein